MSSILSLECVRRCLGFSSVRPEQAIVVRLLTSSFELEGKRCVCKYTEASGSREVSLLPFAFK